MDPSRPTSESSVSVSQIAAAGTAGGESALSKIPSRRGYFRWVICTLLLLGTTKNYMDRNVLGVLRVTLQHDLGWNEIDYGNLVIVFQAAYALGMLAVGWLVDRLGTRLGYALAMIFWSLASMGTALASSLTGFAVSRFALGFGEAAVFPASIKTVAEWFPKKERALATGIFNSGTNVGALVTPLVVPWITLHWGWQWAFMLTGALGFLWVGCWLAVYRQPEDQPRLKPSELAYIRSGPADPTVRIPWGKLLPHRQTWAFALAKFITNPVWWLYLFWIPDFFYRKHGLDLKNIGLPIVVIYIVADVGSIGGGWLSSRLMKLGWSHNRARKTAMLVCALCAAPVMFAPRTSNLWVAVALISLAAAAHQGWSANLFTLPSDMFPRKAVGSVIGIGGAAGAVGGMFIAMLVGAILQATGGNYALIFI